MFNIANPQLVHDLSQKITQIALQINAVEIVTPTNVAEMKARWIESARKGIFINPNFIYSNSRLTKVMSFKQEFSTASSQLLAAISPNDMIDTAVYEIIKSRLDDTYFSIMLAESIYYKDDTQSGYYTARKYGRPNIEQVDTAQLMATNAMKLGDFKPRFDSETQKRLKALTFNAEGIRKVFERAIEFYGISGWEVIVSLDASAIDVRNKTANGKPCVVIPTDREVNGLKLIELIGHEIECHLRDSENAAQLFARLLGKDSPLAPIVPLLAKPDNELFYEGHAKMSDVAINGNKAVPAPFYTIAQNCALNGMSFCEIADHIYELRIEQGTKDETAIKGAWLATYRALRGCTDTNNPHAYTFGKDYAYLAGFRFVQTMTQSKWLDYASLTISDIDKLRAVGVEPGQPKYPYRDAASFIVSELLKD